MSPCRLFKPFKRWAFRQGRHFTRGAANAFMEKYLLKWLGKREKVAIRRSKHTEFAGASLQRELAKALTKLLAISPPMTENATNIDCEAALLSAEPKLTNLRAAAIEACEQIMVQRQARGAWGPAVEQLVDYALGLRAAISDHAGYDHGKVREYWLLRGPRMVAVLLIVLVVATTCEELLFDHKGGARAMQMRLIIAACGAAALLVSSLFMLYRRVPDAIYGVVSRSAHDYYVSTKRASLGPSPASVVPNGSDDGSFNSGSFNSSFPKYDHNGSEHNGRPADKKDYLASSLRTLVSATPPAPRAPISLHTSPTATSPPRNRADVTESRAYTRSPLGVRAIGSALGGRRHMEPIEIMVRSPNDENDDAVSPSTPCLSTSPPTSCAPSL